MKKAAYLFLLATSVAFLQTPSFAAGPEIWKSGCAYLVGNKVKVDTTCTVKVYANATSSTEEWTLANGNRVVVKSSDKGITVNGQPAEKFDASEVLDVEEPTCYLLKGTKEVYCWGT